MSRETKAIVTPVTKVEIIINTYLTGREQEYIQIPLLQAMTVKPGAKEADMQFDNINVEKMHESTHRTIEKAVVSVSGSTENVLDAILDLRSEEYDFVIAEINSEIKKN